MAGGDEKGFKAAIFRLNWVFILSMSLCTLTGLLFISVSVIWKQEFLDKREKIAIFELGRSVSGNQAAADAVSSNSSIGFQAKPLANQVTELLTFSNERDVLGADILRDLGIAVLISVIVTVSIEMYASNRLREHIAYDVLSAAYAKVVPEQIYTQIADNVFKSDVYRRNWKVHISARPEQVDKSRNIAVITANHSYDVENLKESRVPFRVVASIDLDDPPPFYFDDPLKSEVIPNFTSFAVDDDHNNKIVEEESSKKLLGQLPKAISDMKAAGNVTVAVREGNLNLEQDPREIRLTADVNIPARRSVTVRFQVKRAIRVPGYYMLNSPVPADGIEIIMNVEGFKLTVVPLHPHREALINPQRDTWQFDAGILPWQGFRFTSEI